MDQATRRNYFLRGTGSRAGLCQVRPEVRRLVDFRQINFMDPRWPLRGRFDVVFCRNVIIYFDLATQQRITLRLGEQLTDAGYLILGHSEHPTWLVAQFTSCGQTIYQRKSAAGAKPLGWLRVATPPAPPPEASKLQRRSIIAGEYFAAATPTEIATGLGSCVAACLFDPQARIGGMNHFMLPGSENENMASARYGVHAMELLINAIMQLGGDRRRLQAKIFGGSHVLCYRNAVSDVGGHNCRFVRQFMETERIPVVAERLGGNHPLRVLFHPHSGRALVKAIPRLCRNSDNGEGCRNCPRNKLAPLPQGDVTLF